MVIQTQNWMSKKYIKFRITCKDKISDKIYQYDEMIGSDIDRLPAVVELLNKDTIFNVSDE